MHNFMSQEYRNVIQYVVKQGDSLYTIAQKYNLTTDELISFNKLTTNMLYPNQILFIPQGTTASKNIYITNSGDTIGNILNTYNLSINNFLKWNDLTALKLMGNQALKIANASEPKYHTVSKSDSFEDIIKKYGISPLELLKLNAEAWLTENTKIIVG